MITNMIPSFLQVLEESPFVFHLTGSRFFGDSKESSDWDFFTQYSNEVETFLKNYGFDYHIDYKDEGISVVMRGILPGDRQADIILVDDIDTRIKAQEILKPHIRYLPKPARSVIWTVTLEALRAS